MKKEKIETLVDSYVDNEGNTRHFILAAISEPIPDYEYAYCTNNGWRNYLSYPLVKGLKFGYAICNPTDTFNEKLGKTIAIGRAKKSSKYAMLVSEPGYINTNIAKVFLSEMARYFKNNPEEQMKEWTRKR